MPAPLEAGTFLIASLALEDVGEPNFTRTVVLLLQHEEDEGTVGVVVNRPLGEKVKLYTSQALQNLIDGLETVQGTPVEPSTMFFQGGPVDKSSLIFLHQLNGLIEDGTEVCRDLYVGGELNAIHTHTVVMDSETPLLRFYLGYASWEPGQLEDEISQDAWILCPGSAGLVLSITPETVWQEALYSLEGRYRAISLIPDNVLIN